MGSFAQFAHARRWSYQAELDLLFHVPLVSRICPTITEWCLHPQLYIPALLLQPITAILESQLQSDELAREVELAGRISHRIRRVPGCSYSHFLV